MDDDYDAIVKKPLKLAKSKDKKSKSSSSSPTLEPIIPLTDDSKIIETTITKAELAFKSKQDKIAESRILKKATTTHKQRVEEFNKHLDSLSEHYDIPKVSWTK